MVRNETELRRRGSLSMFYVTCTGFFTAVSGVVVSSVFWSLVGLGLMFWGFAYFGRQAR